MEDTLEFNISRLKLLDCSNNKSATQWCIKLEQELNFLFRPHHCLLAILY